MGYDAQTILIADDEQLNLKLLKACLSSEGYLIWEAETGQEALEKAKRKPDLILLDIMMPNMDGFETCRRLKQCKDTKEITVIFLFALEDLKTKVRCFEMGGVDYIGKPFETQEVLARVKTQLTLSRQERQLKEYTNRLEQMVEERTKQLIHADRLATLGTFSACIAHEIRNPLTGINTHLYNLEELCESDLGFEPERINILKGVIGQLHSASNKIEAVIKRVLDFSKPIPTKMVLVDLNTSLEEAMKLASVTLRKEGIKVEYALAKPLPECYADPILIEQLILNLINNAAREMQDVDGIKKIKVASTWKNNRILIDVSDSGPGIPLEIKNRVFDPFFTTRPDGSGLGLSIAHRIVMDHSGKIYVTDSEWGGALFRVELPIEKRRGLR